MANLGEKRPTQLGTSATLIYQPVGTRDSITVTNEGKDIAYLGQSGVTATTGLPLWPGDHISLNRVPMAVYGVSAATGGAPFVTIVAGIS